MTQQIRRAFYLLFNCFLCLTMLKFSYGIYAINRGVIKMNHVLNTIADRFSCRGYEDRTVEKEKIIAIAKAALQSPSALNRQPWHIVAISDKGLVDEINDHVMDMIKARDDQSAYNRIMERGGKPYYNAPAMFLILKKEDAADWADLDCGIVSQNISLAATSLGLGNVIAAMCGTAFDGPRAEEFKAKVKWPAGYKFSLGVLVGYGNTTKEPHEIDLSKVTYL